MSVDIYKEGFEHVELFKKPALFTNSRIDRSTVPYGVYVYDLRHGDSGDPVTVELNVAANHAGTVVLTEPLDFGGETPENSDKHISIGDGLNFLGDSLTLGEFIAENSTALKELKNAAKLIEDMTGCRFKSSIGEPFIYHPDSDKYLVVNMHKESDYHEKLYRIYFTANIQTMGKPLNAYNLFELQREVGQAHALLTALEMQSPFKLSPVEMQEFNGFVREQDRQYEEQEESDDPVMEQSM